MSANTCFHVSQHIELLKSYVNSIIFCNPPNGGPKLACPFGDPLSGGPKLLQTHDYPGVVG